MPNSVLEVYDKRGYYSFVVVSYLSVCWKMLEAPEQNISSFGINPP
jgi:hypothetical protein